jgi:tight adherence protein B
VSAGIALLALGAFAGALAALAIREAVLASPALAEWLRAAVDPLVRAGSEGYLPSAIERRRLAALGAAVAVAGGWLAGGTAIALPLAVAGPLVAGSWVRARRARYRRGVERALPEIAHAVADSLTGGRSMRGALAAAAASLDGPPAVEMSRVGVELGLGSPTPAALAALRVRVPSPRIDAFASALLSQRLSGGDLAGLLRRFGEGAAERDRAADDARAATAQARFTGLLVAAMPMGAALFAELLDPGFFSRMLQSPIAIALLACSAALQVAGFAAIRRLAQIGDG